MAVTIVFLIAAVSVSAAHGASVPLQRPDLEKVLSYNSHKIRLTWQPVSGAEGYQVYRAASEKSKFKRIAVIDTPDSTVYTDSGRTTGRSYYYKVRAFRDSGSRRVYSRFSVVKSAYARPVKVKNLETEWQQTGYRLKWSPVKGADGYQVAVRQAGDDAWHKGWYYKPGPTYEETIFVGNIKVEGTEAIVQTGNCNYEFRVRAYIISEGKKVWGRYSDIAEPLQQVTAEELKAAAEEYIMKKYPHAQLKTVTGRTPENSGWGPVWPRSFSRYESAEKIVREKLGKTLDFYAENFWNASAGGTPAGSIFVREEDCCLSVWWIA